MDKFFKIVEKFEKVLDKYNFKLNINGKPVHWDNISLEKALKRIEKL